jgi:hypothetical protein
LEIVVDDKVASLTVSISDGDGPASERMVAVEEVQETFIRTPPPDQSGTLHYANLTPGEYRVLAVRKVAPPDGNDVRQAIHNFGTGARRSRWGWEMRRVFP